ncbi:MAG: hypothetical protein WB791_06655 [Waddliaceae bacterium]
MTSLSISPSGTAGWEIITLSSHSEEKYRFPYSKHYGEVYNFDPDLLIRCKCVALTLLTPPVSAARTVCRIAKAAFLLLTAAYHYLDDQKIPALEKQAIRIAALDSGRALYYGVQMTGCAIWGIFSPYDARHEYAKLERTLNRHQDGPHRDKYYLAICFQPLAVVPNFDKEEQKRIAAKLDNTIHRYLTLLRAVFACSPTQFRSALRKSQTANVNI